MIRELAQIYSVPRLARNADARRGQPPAVLAAHGRTGRFEPLAWGCRMSAPGTSATFWTREGCPLSAPEADIRGLLSAPVYESRIFKFFSCSRGGSITRPEQLARRHRAQHQASAINLPMLDMGAEDCRSRETRLQRGPPPPTGEPRGRIASGLQPILGPGQSRSRPRSRSRAH